MLGPWVDDRDPGVGEVVGVASGENGAVAPARRSDLGIGGADRPAASFPAHDDVGVVSCCGLVERNDTVIELITDHRLDVLREVVLALSVGEPGDSVEQLRNRDGREVDVGRGLTIDPFHDLLGRYGAHQLGHDIGVENDQGNVAACGCSVRVGNSSSTPPIAANCWRIRVPS